MRRYVVEEMGCDGETRERKLHRQHTGGVVDSSLIVGGGTAPLQNLIFFNTNGPWVKFRQ